MKFRESLQKMVRKMEGGCCKVRTRFDTSCLKTKFSQKLLTNWVLAGLPTAGRLQKPAE